MYIHSDEVSMGCIYKITNNINHKIYIGYTTTDLHTRMQKHKTDDPVKETVLGRAIKKYGWDNFSYEALVEEDNKEKLLELEQYYIKLYDCCILDGQEKGYNMTRGGEKLFGDSNPFYGKTHSEETKKKLSELASARTGEKNGFYGKKHSEETKRKISEANSKQVAAIDKDGNIILKFKSGAAARDYLLKNNLSKDKTCNSTIVKAIKNHKKVYGYYWMYI